MFCVLYFSSLLFWFFQSTNLFVAYYSDKFNSTEKGPAQLILSLYHIPIVIYSYILLFLLCSQKYGFWANYSILLQVYSYNSIRKCSCSARFTRSKLPRSGHWMETTNPFSGRIVVICPNAPSAR